MDEKSSQKKREMPTFGDDILWRKCQSLVSSSVGTGLGFSVFFGSRAFDIFVRVFFGLSGHDYYVTDGYLVTSKVKTC